MTRTIGIGVIGMGWMGEVHSRAYRALPDRFHDSGIRLRQKSDHGVQWYR